MSVVLALLLGGVVEFGFLFSHKLELTNGARTGARWASLHSTSWTASASPASNTIEGQVQAAGGTSLVSNDDQHVTIEYFSVTGATQTLCGHYSAAAPGFVAAGGFSQATCVIPGNLVRVTLTNSYPLLTKLLGGGVGANVTVKAVSVMPVMV